MVLLISACLVLTCTLVHADVVSEDKCAALDKCLEPVLKFGLNSGVVFFAEISEKKLEEMCQLVPRLHTCVTNYSDLCNNRRALYLDGRAVYLCSEEGKKELLKLIKSKCFTDTKGLEKFLQWLVLCIKERLPYGQGKLSEHEYACTFHDLQSQCSNKTFTNLCENDMAQFLEKVNSVDKQSGRCGQNQTTQNTKETKTDVRTTDKPELTTVTTSTQEKIEELVVAV